MASEDLNEKGAQSPLRPDNVSVSLEDIWQVDATHETVTVQWKTPNREGEFNYLIKYKNEAGSQWEFKSTPDSKTKINEIEITCLKPDNSYKVIIFADDSKNKSVEQLYEIIVKTKESKAKQLSQKDFSKKQQTTQQNMPIYRIEPVKRETVEDCVQILTFFEEENEMTRILNNEKNIIFLGATGAGKSTLVDASFNYLAGVSLADNFRLQITEENKNADQTQTQTETATCYTLPKTEYLLNNCSLNIIDTPGFNDTDENFQMTIVKQVKAILTRILVIHAICIVIPLSTFRLMNSQKNVFNGIFELFAHDVSDIMYCLFTFDDDGQGHILKAFNDAEIILKHHFRFCNSKLFDNISDNNADVVWKKWNNNSLNFKQFLDNIYQAKGKSMSLTKQVLNEVENLYIQIEGLKYNVGNSAQKIINIRQELQLLNENKDKLQWSENVQYILREEKRVYTRIPNKRSCFNCQTCNRTCHKNCWAKFKFLYWTCDVIKSGICSVCTCSSANHVNESAIYDVTYEEVPKTGEDLTKKYKNAEDAKEQLKQGLRELDIIIKKVKSCISQLQDKALRYNALTVEDYIKKLHEEECSDMKLGYEDRAKIYAMLLVNIEFQEPAMKLLDL